MCRNKPDARNSWCEAAGWTESREGSRSELHMYMLPEVKVEVCNFADDVARVNRNEQWESVRIGPLSGHG